MQVLGVIALLVVGLLIGGCGMGRDNGTGNSADVGKPNVGNAPPETNTSK